MTLKREHFLFALMCLIWGATWIAVKAGLSSVPPALFAGTRFVAAGLVLLMIIYHRGESMRLAGSHLLRFAAVTGLVIVATYFLLFWGAKFVSSGLAAILDLAFVPVALLVVSLVLGEEKINFVKAAGVGVGVIGLVILFGPKAFSNHAGSRSELIGSAAIVLSALTYGLGSVLARPLLDIYSPLLISGTTMLSGGILLLVGSLAFEPGSRDAVANLNWGSAAWAGWLFLVVFGSLIAFTIFLELVRSWGPSSAGAYSFISPAIAVVLGVVVFGEVITAVDAAGMITMLGGAWLTLRQ